MREIVLSTGQTLLIDDADYDEVSQHSWRVSRWGYARRNICVGTTRNSKGKAVPKKRAQLLHQFLMGSPPPGMIWDHIDRNKFNNQRSNFRLCTIQQNNMNRAPKSGHKYKGIYYVKKTGKYRVFIKINDQQIYLGTVSDEVEAAKKYDEAAMRHFGNFAYLNFQK